MSLSLRPSLTRLPMAMGALLLALAVSGPAAAHEGTASSPEATALASGASPVMPSAAARHVLAVRPVPRRCRPGHCRSLRVQAVNQSPLDCGRGRQAATCLIRGLDLQGLPWTDTQRKAFERAFFQGQALALGEVVVPTRGAGARLRVRAGWIGQSTHAPLGVFYKVRRPADACGDSVCSLTLDADALDGHPDVGLHPGLDLSTTGVKADRLALGMQSLTRPQGLIVVGLAVPFRPPGDATQADATPRKLLATEFYVPVEP